MKWRFNIKIFKVFIQYTGLCKAMANYWYELENSTFILTMLPNKHLDEILCWDYTTKDFTQTSSWLIEPPITNP